MYVFIREYSYCVSFFVSYRREKECAMSYLTMRDGTKIYYEDQGIGETLLFCHGLNCSHLYMKDFMKEFRGEYRLVCYDQRGHGASDRAEQHVNVETLAQDLNELIETLDLKGITAIGHSLGATTLFSYVDQFGCGRLKRMVVVDMSPKVRNDDWKGGNAQGRWTDEDFMQEMERIFDDAGYAEWYLNKTVFNPSLSDTGTDMDEAMSALYGKVIDPFTMAGLMFSLYRTDLRDAIGKIEVPFLYIMPETPLFSKENVDYIMDHVKKEFVLKKDFPGTTHDILKEKPHEAADGIKDFIKEFYRYSI